MGQTRPHAKQRQVATWNDQPPNEMLYLWSSSLIASLVSPLVLSFLRKTGYDNEAAKYDANPS